jgi:hypothetical protein
MNGQRGSDSVAQQGLGGGSRCGGARSTWLLAALIALSALLGAGLRPVAGVQAAASGGSPTRASAAPVLPATAVSVPHGQYAAHYNVVDLGPTGTGIPSAGVFMSRHSGLILAGPVVNGANVWKIWQIANGAVGSPTPASIPACFGPHSMNDAGTVVGAYDCGPLNGESAMISINGTISTPTPVAGPATTLDAKGNALPITYVLSTDGKSDGRPAYVNLFAINDGGQAVGDETAGCLIQGVGSPLPCTFAIEYDGSSVHPVGGLITGPAHSPNCSGFDFPEKGQAITDNGLIVGNGPACWLPALPQGVPAQYLPPYVNWPDNPISEFQGGAPAQLTVDAYDFGNLGGWAVVDPEGTVNAAGHVLMSVGGGGYPFSGALYTGGQTATPLQGGAYSDIAGNGLNDYDVVVGAPASGSGASIYAPALVWSPSQGVQLLQSLTTSTIGFFQAAYVDDNADVLAFANDGNGYAMVVAIPSSAPTGTLTFVNQPQSTTAGAALQPVTVAVEDSTGAVVTGATGSITLSLGSNPGSATLSGTTTQALVNGVATFPNLSLNVVGTGYTLVAADSDPTVTAVTSASFNIEALHLVFSIEPQSSTVGAVLPSVVVSVQDPSGATVTGASGSIGLTLGNNPGGATLGGTLTEPLQAGMATFSDLTLNRVGTGYTLVAAASQSGVTTATSTAFDITGPHLAFTVQPQSVLPDKPLKAVKVSALDKTGAVMTKASGTVTIALQGGTVGATLAGTLTQPLVHGVATFRGLKVSLPGTSYTLMATDSDPTVSPATSVGFAVSATLLLVAPTDSVWANGHATATLTVQFNDSTGKPIASTRLKATADPASGVKIEDKPIVTDKLGGAKFDVTSTETGKITITVSDASDPAVSAQATVIFDRHKVLVLFLGIRTGLNCDPSTFTCQVLDGDTNNPDADGFDPVETVLTGSPGFDTTDIIRYSYTGGSVDGKTGHWKANSYGCADTAESYTFAIARLRTMLREYTTANPNTDLYLVGHSQGGLIAFQSLGLADALGPKTALKGIITLDSPLGGAPQNYVNIPAKTTCWNGPANHDQVALYNTSTVHTQQGSTATMLCALLGDCAFGDGETNSGAVAANPGTQVQTFGNTDDAVYNVASCAGYAIGNVAGYVDNTSTEVVAGAGGGLASLGGNISPPGLNPIDAAKACASSSHARVYLAHAADIIATLGNQTSVLQAKTTP